MIRTSFHCLRARLFYFQFIDWTTRELPRIASSIVTLLAYAFIMKNAPVDKLVPSNRCGTVATFHLGICDLLELCSKSQHVKFQKNESTNLH